MSWGAESHSIVNSYCPMVPEVALCELATKPFVYFHRGSTIPGTWFRGVAILTFNSSDLALSIFQETHFLREKFGKSSTFCHSNNEKTQIPLQHQLRTGQYHLRKGQMAHASSARKCPAEYRWNSLSTMSQRHWFCGVCRVASFLHIDKAWQSSACYSIVLGVLVK